MSSKEKGPKLIVSVPGMISNREWTLTARWVFPVDRPPLEHGTVTVCGDRLVSVDQQGQRQPDQDLGQVAVLPGLVNAHTHLDLTGLRGRCPPQEDFTAWLQGVIDHRRATPPEQIAQDIRRGLAECLAYGTTLVGDIAGSGDSWDVLAAAPIRSVVFYELLGLGRARAEQSWQSAEAWLHQHPPGPQCRPGLSPHAPYSTCCWLYERAAEAGRPQRLPLATHLAETPLELELLARQSGPLVRFLKDLDAWDPSGLVTSEEEAGRLLAGAPTSLFAHGNFLDPRLPFLTGGVVIYCPRTHAAFGHPRHPFRDILARGFPVALGTDSLASNPDLDLLAEARFLHRRYPDLAGETLLCMATLWGAEALGWQEETGSLTPGKSADLVVVPLPEEGGVDPHTLLLGSSDPAQAVLFRGEWLTLK
jgi:cytosine/adenosine deaminase-related metal-dependent hydrolase